MNQREQVFNHLVSIFKAKAFSHLELRTANLDAFHMKLIHTILDQFEFLTYQFESFLAKPITIEGQLLLAMVVAQKHYFDAIPDYANLNEVVSLSKKVTKSYTSLINAVGKKLLKQPLIYKQDGSLAENLAVNTSTPLWIVKLLISQYSEEVATKLCHHFNTQPKLDGRINTDKPDWKVQVSDYKISDVEFLPAIIKSDLIQQGYAILQDRNSQRLIESLNFDNINTILDTCAGPGTKTVQLAKQFPNAKIDALELHPARAQLVADNCQRWDCNHVNVHIGDATSYDYGKVYDLIFCDVPCSGLGVIRRKPDIKRNINSQQLDDLQKVQAAILQHSAQFVRVGGFLVYATCTLNKKENEKQIEHFLNTHPQFSLIQSDTILGYQNDGDCFYQAILLKQH